MRSRLFLLYPVFFLSGAAALVFEAVWFRLAGQMLGNSIWASSVVLAGFMGGLALGNALAARQGHRLTRPIRFYGLLEIVVAVAGIALVFIMPLLNRALTPLFQPFLENPWMLNPLRLVIAFVLLLAPTTAMGATLPVLIRGLCVHEPSFGRALGLLYGFNTLGALAGALIGEFVLIEAMGLRGSAWAAGAANVAAALFAVWLQRAASTLPAGEAPESTTTLNGEAKRLLLAAFLCGATLLALEVFWFRFLSQFMLGSSSFFAIMLAVVLAGIGLGGLVAGAWAKRAGAHRHGAAVALISAAMVIVTYWSFIHVKTIAYSGSFANQLLHGIRLMLPVSLLSGVLFTLIGQRLRGEIASDARAGGYLTLANTIGAMLGALVGGFVMLPTFGVERSMFIAAFAYCAVAVALAWGVFGSIVTYEKLSLYPSAAVAVFLLIGFPFGLMEEKIIPFVTQGYVKRNNEKIIEVREGLNETILYTRGDRYGQPYYHRLITNGYFMSGTGTPARRYMKAFVYLPAAVHPDPKRALLISYGVGMTAKALTDTSWIEKIDVVDISRDILEMNRIVYPDPREHPLNDPRVTVHIEDGRFFLLTTEQQFDLITGEPPPPKAAGIGNLYSREYFELMYDRLAPGGMATYWLPVNQLLESDTRAILRAFADVFDDCSLWSGAHAEWMMLGVKPGGQPVTDAQFRRQWLDPVIVPEMRALGFESPEQLGSTFIAGRATIDRLTQHTPPLTDNDPLRLSPVAATPATIESRYAELWEPRNTLARFMQSEHVRRLWPKSILDGSANYFTFRAALHDCMSNLRVGQPILPHAVIHRMLTQSDMTVGVLWQYRTDLDEVRIIEATEQRDSKAHYNLGAWAMAQRRFDQAVEHFRASRQANPDAWTVVFDELFALCMAKRMDEAQHLAEQVVKSGRQPSWGPVWWAFAREKLGLSALE